jgi:hypothetical protein
MGGKRIETASMFELAKWWVDAVKAVGAGNGAGLIATGAALSPFYEHHHALFFIKVAGVIFFVGVITFAIALAMLHRAVFEHDEQAHAFIKKDAEALREHNFGSRYAMSWAPI